MQKSRRLFIFSKYINHRRQMCEMSTCVLTGQWDSHWRFSRSSASSGLVRQLNRWCIGSYTLVNVTELRQKRSPLTLRNARTPAPRTIRLCRAKPSTTESRMGPASWCTKMESSLSLTRNFKRSSKVSIKESSSPLVVLRTEWAQLRTIRNVPGALGKIK